MSNYLTEVIPEIEFMCGNLSINFVRGMSYIGCASSSFKGGEMSEIWRFNHILGLHTKFIQFC